MALPSPRTLAVVALGLAVIAAVLYGRDTDDASPQTEPGRAPHASSAQSDTPEPPLRDSAPAHAEPSAPRRDEVAAQAEPGPSPHVPGLRSPAPTRAKATASQATRADAPGPSAPLPQTAPTAATPRHSAGTAPVVGTVASSPSPASASAPVSRATLRKDDIRAAIRSVSPGIRGCFRQALAQDPSIAGRILIEFVIEARDGRGRIVSGEVPETELNSPFFEACVLEQVVGAEFPAPTGEGQVKVRYPFTFDPGGGFGGNRQGL